jgi:hypothetical protein
VGDDAAADAVSRLTVPAIIAVVVLLAWLR